MIATLSGIVSEKLIEQVVIDVGGVGYGVFVTAEDYGHLEKDGQTKLLIYENIKENSYDLFGFLGMDTKVLFELLLSVNGVGARMGINILSIGTADEVKQAIATGDTKFIQRASGVGKRVAERVVVDLKDKVGLEGVDLESTGLLQAESKLVEDDAVKALVTLGFSSQDAVTALQGIEQSLPTEERVRQALKVKK